MAEDGVLLPRFFKVFLSESSSESLMIPLTFMEHLDDPLPKTVKLQGIGGRTWTVSLTKVREQVYFTDGWSNFADEHDLKDGEFLTFVYDGHRRFEVSLYGRLGCKEIRAAAQNSDSDDEKTSKGGDVDEDEEISLSIYPFVSEETETDAGVSLGISNLELIANPCFETKLKKRIYELLIPANVVYENGLTFGESITYIDGEGKSFIGERGKWNDDRVCFKGWGRICRRNRLKSEDTVKCELLHTQKLVHSIRIHVKRGAA